jgi:hypothetical protein
LVRTATVSRLRRVAVGTVGLESSRPVVLFQPHIELTDPNLSAMLITAAVNVVNLQKLSGGLTATGTSFAVNRKHFIPELGESCPVPLHILGSTVPAFNFIWRRLATRHTKPGFLFGVVDLTLVFFELGLALLAARLASRIVTTESADPEFLVAVVSLQCRVHQGCLLYTWILVNPSIQETSPSG